MFAKRFRTVYAQMNNKRKIDSLKLRLLSSEKNALTLSNDLPERFPPITQSFSKPCENFANAKMR